MNKKHVLIVYPEMMVGGSTTSLIAFLNCIDKEKYEVDLQLYKNRGALMGEIPAGIKVLPEAFLHNGKMGNVVKKMKFLLTGAALKARTEQKKIEKKGYSGQVMADFQAKFLSRKSKIHYDFAIGFMEGWSVRYVAHCVDAGKKFGWLHSTFENLAPIPPLERPWMNKVDHIVFVADNCRDDFCAAMPEMADKAVTILNITDGGLLQMRAEQQDENDAEFVRFRDADCFKIITVCRITISVKGLDRAINCAKKLKACGKKFFWMIVGSGEQLKQFRAMIEQAGLSDCMAAIGNRMNPLPFVKAADVFCLLSRYEGKPMVITESMILGTPPFVTRYLSASEQIQSGVEGVIVENGDDTMFEVLNDYIQRPAAIQEMKAFLTSQDYSNCEYMREIEQKYLNS